jgi:CHAT domain-containing protein/tetratricopeptide (TPR) repeat protein
LSAAEPLKVTLWLCLEDVKTSSPIPWPFEVAGLLTCLALVPGCGVCGTHLEPGVPLKRTIDAGERHSYWISLHKGELLEVTAEQAGADVVLTLRDPAGFPMVDTDSPNGPRGPERLFAVADEEGRYVLEVERPSQYGSDPGSYQLDVARRMPTPRDLLRAKASRLRAAGDSTAEGLEALQEAASLWHQTEEPYLGAATRLEVAVWYWKRRSYEEALKALDEADQRISNVGATDLEPALLNARGDTLRALRSEPKRAEMELEQALTASRDLGSRWQEAGVLSNLGLLYQDRREAWEALGFFDASLSLFKELGDAEQIAHLLQNRGELLNWLGRQPEAEVDLESALKIREELGVQSEIAESLRALGWVDKWQGNLERAERRIEKALAIFRNENRRLEEAVCLDRLGRIYLETGRPERAREAHWQAVRGFRKEGDARSEAHAFNNLGQALRHLGQLGEARKAYEEALQLFKEHEDPSGVAHSLAFRAQIRRLEGDLHGSWEDVQNALNLLEEIRQNARSPTFRSHYMASVHEHFELAVDLLMDLHTREPDNGWMVRAFEMAERSRARTLLELVTGLTGERRRQEGPISLLAERGELSRALRTQAVAVRLLETQGASGEELEAAHRRLSDLILEWEHREGEAFETGKAGASIAPRSLSEIREALAPEVSLLTFSLGEHRSFVWLLGPEGLIARELPPRAEIRAAVSAALDDVAPGEGSLEHEDRNLALDLVGALLLGSLPQAALTRRLIVVPDGVLHRLPFSALRLEGRYLMQDHEIVRVPSASVLVTLRERKHQRTESSKLLALMADPVFQPGDPRLFNKHLSSTGASRLPAPAVLGQLGRLPESGKEVDAIASLVPRSCRWTAKGFEASRERVEQGRLAGFHLIHLATHAVLDDERPETSGIVLSAFDDQGRSREGYLYAFEIAELHLSADLVVLSACSTGLGHEIRGEGLVGLTQSFLEAGADRVLVSLWNVDDAATAELMGHFYRGLLRDRLSPAEALRHAQERLRRGKTWNDPYYWASFSLVGNWGELSSTLLASPCLVP